MSLKANLEFGIQLKKFRNVDLFEPGFYYIKFTIVQESNKKNFARPYSLHERTPKGLEDKYQKPIIRPFILSSTPTYVSKTFSVSLNDDEVILNESCYFRTEFNVFPKFENNNYCMEAELMYLDFNSFSLLKEADEEKKLSAFKKLDSYSGIIKNAELGIHEHVPLFFEFRNSCALEVVFHSAVLNLRIPTTETISQPDQNGDQKENPLFQQTAKLKTLFNKKILTIEFLDDFYLQCISPVKSCLEHLLQFYASMIRLYMKEADENCFLQFLETLPTKGEIMEYLVDGGTKENTKGRITYFQSYEENKTSDKNSAKKLSEILNFTNPELLLFAIAQEMITTNSKMFHTWRSLNEVMLEVPRLVIWNLQKNYNNLLKACFQDKLIQKTYRTSDLTLSLEENVGEIHNRMALSKRASMLTKNKNNGDTLVSIIDTNLFQTQGLHPVIFEEISVKDNLPLHDNESICSNIEKNCVKNAYHGVHLIVLSHGFQGSSFDLRLLKNTINFLYPDTLVLCASSNEEETEGEISKMGVRLASEVKCYIDEWVKEENLGRLSFIGHSLGGLIIRAALPYLEPYVDKMHMFMSFSTAHLGYFSHSSKLVDVGMWLMRQWKGSKCLRELSLADAENIEDTYLYKLSKKKGLNWFKHIVFLSSYQDHYAPFQSARIQMSRKSFPDPERQATFEQMARNILSDISADCIYRIDANFSIQETTLDSMLGRTAHIQFLESHYLIKMLVCRYANFFS